MKKIKKVSNKVFSVLFMLIFVFTPIQVNGAEYLQTGYNQINKDVLLMATISDAREKKATSSDIEDIPDIIIKIDEDKENLEDEIEPRSRAEVISKYDILKIYGKTDKGVYKTERFSQAQRDTEVFRTQNTYQREGLEIDIVQCGSIGNVSMRTPDCRITQKGKPYNCTYDSYGGLVEWSTNNTIQITNPDISELHIQFMVTTTYPYGGGRILKRDVYIPLADSRKEAPQTPEIIYDESYPDAYVLTGIDSSMEYVIMSERFRAGFAWQPCPDENIILTPEASKKTCLVRYKSDDNDSESKYKELTLPARRSAPSISLDKENEILKGLTTEMEYSVNGSQYTAVTQEFALGDVSQLIDEITDSDSVELKIRYSINNSPVSFDKSIILYKRLLPPSEVTFNPVSIVLTGTKSGMEYCVDTENKWRTISSSTVNLKNYASPDSDVHVQVRYKATNTNAHSDSIKFTISKLETAPTGLNLNCPSEVITGFDISKNYEYATSATGSYYKVTLTTDGMFQLKNLISSSARELFIRESATAERPFSASAKITIPGRRKAPQGVVFAYDDINTPETQVLLQGITTSMEYKLSNETEWHPVTGETMLFDIPQKAVTYYIREKATENDFVSSNASVALRTYQSAPGCYIDANIEAIRSVATTMEYRIPGQEFSAINSTANIDVSGIANQLSSDETYVMEFRYKRRTGYPVGIIKALTINPRPKAPDNLSYNKETYELSGVSNAMQYREVGTTSWKSISRTTINLKTLINGRTDVQVEVRYKPVSTNNNVVFASNSTIVNLY